MSLWAPGGGIEGGGNKLDKQENKTKGTKSYVFHSFVFRPSVTRHSADDGITNANETAFF